MNVRNDVLGVPRLIETIAGRLEYPVTSAGEIERALDGHADDGIELAPSILGMPSSFFPVRSRDDLTAKIAFLVFQAGAPSAASSSAEEPAEGPGFEGFPLPMVRTSKDEALKRAGRTYW